MFSLLLGRSTGGWRRANENAGRTFIGLRLGEDVVPLALLAWRADQMVDLFDSIEQRQEASRARLQPSQQSTVQHTVLVQLIIDMKGMFVPFN